MMRIITGRARGVRLSTLEGDNTRPTAERTKEAIFSMLQFDLLGKEVLDLFAGSGQLGLEAVSRGASHAVFADRSKAAVEIIQKNLLKTKLAPFCDVYCMDFHSLLQNMKRKKSFDIVFLDPPYAMGLVPQALTLLTEYGLLNEGAKIVCETANAEDVFAGCQALEQHFSVIRSTHYGIAQVTVLQFLGKGEYAL